VPYYYKDQESDTEAGGGEMTGNHPPFVVLAVLAILCGLAIGAGLAMTLNVVRICVPAHNISAQGNLVCRPLDQYTKNQVVLLLLMFGAIAGIIPHTGPFHDTMNRLVGKIEKRAQERDIKEFFHRYYR
jgi:hypothetical protein